MPLDPAYKAGLARH